ncbi:MAG TPA: glycosyltransferase [Chloroflexota bacterium]
MKILIVSKALVLSSYRHKLTELARLGVDVTAVIPPYWRDSGGLQRFEQGQDEGLRVILSPTRLNGHYHVHYYPQLPHIIRRARPDLIQLDEEPYNLATFLGARAARRLGIPSVFFTWQNIDRSYPLPFRLMEKRVYRWSARALAGSHEAATVLRQKGYARPVSVVPQFGVDPNVFHPGPRGNGCFRIGFLNRLIPGKAPLIAVEAVASLDGDAHMLMVGDGEMRQDVRSAIKARNLGARVTLRHRVPSSEMPDVMRGLDVVILPSLTTPTWKEQFGRVLIEAMACGIPVVGSDSGEIPNVIGDAGLIVPEGDAQALADALRRLRSEPALSADLAERGRKRVLERFTHAHIAAATLRAYEQMLA